MSDTPVLTIDSRLVLPRLVFEDTCKISWSPTQEEQDDCELENKLYCVLLRTQMTSEEFCAKYNMKPSTYCLMFFASPNATDEQAEQSLRDLIGHADELEFAPGDDLDLDVGAETH